MHRLALRMLGHRSDAEDATQEVLIRITTRLATFRGEAGFRTWAYRVAANHLLTTRARRMENPAVSFEAFAADLAVGLDTRYAVEGVDAELLADEVRVGCTQAMLLCLDREHRLAYILSEIFSLPGADAAFVSGVSAATYRKRVSRARERVITFMSGHCGLVNVDSPCRCARRVGVAIERARIDPAATTPAEIIPTAVVAEAVRDMSRLEAAATVLRSHPRYAEPRHLATEVARLVRSGALRSLDN